MADNVTDLLDTIRAQIEEGMEFTRENIPGGAIGVVVMGAVVYISYKYLRSHFAVGRTKAKIQARQAKIKANFDWARKLVKQHEKEIDLSICDLTFDTLQEKLQRGEIKATQVLLAYIAKSLKVTGEINAVTEYVDEAWERAIALDRLPASQRGPLHGIPLSLKEAVGVKNSDCTSGISCLINKTYEVDGIILQVLHDQGANAFCRTNLPQGQSAMSCGNPLFGETLHPKDHTRTCGGSTGGEAALMGAGGSVAGVGCDLGGSIRIPSHFCGVVGIKPTPTRISSVGNYSLSQGINCLPEVYGPMGRDVKTCVELFKATLSPRMFKLDPVLPEIPWREEMFSSQKPMRIGFYTYDGGLQPHPVVKRLLFEAKAKLEKRGHTFVDFEVPDILQCAKMFFGAGAADGLVQMHAYMKDDVCSAASSGMMMLMAIPHSIRALLSKLLPLHPVEKVALSVPCATYINRWWDLNEEVKKYTKKFLDQCREKNIDCLLCPNIPFPAFPIGDESSCLAGGTYTFIYNVLGLPAGSVPGGVVEKIDQEKLKNEYPKTNFAEKYLARISEGAEGMPIGLQCVGLPFQEEVCLRLMAEVEEVMRK